MQSLNDGNNIVVSYRVVSWCVIACRVVCDPIVLYTVWPQIVRNFINGGYCVLP